LLTIPVELIGKEVEIIKIDKAIAEIRAVRHQISEEYGFNRR